MASVLRAAKKMPSPLGRWLESAYARVPFAWRYGTVYRKTYDFLTKSQWWDTDELREYQRRRLRRLLRHAYENVPYYINVFEERGLRPNDFNDVADLQKLPILTKDIIRENHDDLIARNISQWDVVKFSTSGSTGNPLSFIGVDSLYKIEAAFITRAFDAHDSRLYREKSIWLRRYVPDGDAPIYRHDAK